VNSMPSDHKQFLPSICRSAKVTGALCGEVSGGAIQGSQGYCFMSGRLRSMVNNCYKLVKLLTNQS
jgi:hypothetical protein